MQRREGDKERKTWRREGREQQREELAERRTRRKEGG